MTESATARTQTGLVADRPDNRTRMIWLTQLVLAASLVLICVLVLLLSPALFGAWSFSGGVASVIVVTAVTMAVPWAVLPRAAVLAAPLGDLVGIGLMSVETDLRFSFLWVFPITWIASYFGAAALTAGIGLIAVFTLVASASAAARAGSLRFVVVIVCIVFIGITAHLAARQTRAYKNLLHRQAQRLRETIARAEASERRTAEVLNGVDVGIVRIALTGEVRALNDTYVALYGLEAGDPSAPPRSVEYTDFQGSPVIDGARLLSRATRGETFSDERIWLYDVHGRWHALAASSVRMSASAGEESTLLVVHDVTTLVEAERAREQLAAVVSHELRHPLTAIVGNADLALESSSLAEKTRHRFEVILDSAERMSRLVAGMLTGSKGSLESQHPHALVDLGGVVANSVESFAPTAARQSIALHVDVAPALPLAGDAFRLRQLIDNFVSNAIKYTPRDGEVSIRGALHGDRIVLTISDTGIGMTPAEVERVFEPYFRADAARNAAPGTGIGMTIAAEIAREHGGTVEVTSEPGFGTTVTVTLPTEGAP